MRCAACFLLLPLAPALAHTQEASMATASMGCAAAYSGAVALEEEQKQKLCLCCGDQVAAARSNNCRGSARPAVLGLDGEAVGAVFVSMLNNEGRTAPAPAFMRLQHRIRERHRTVLVDWMADVCAWLGLDEECMFLATNYVDRYLSRVCGSKATLQFIGTAALFIADKFECVTPHTATEYASLIGDDVTARKVCCFFMREHVL